MITTLIDQIKTDTSGRWVDINEVKKYLVELDNFNNNKNKHLSLELLGVITDVEDGPGFDEVCLSTVKRVCNELSDKNK
jgi:hypothetical protein